MKYIKFKNLVIDWDSMGVSKEDYNDGKWFVREGKIWSLTNLPNTPKNSFSEICINNDKNLDKEGVFELYLGGIGYPSNPLWGLTGLCIENCDIELFDDLKEMEIKNSDYFPQYKHFGNKKKETIKNQCV